MIPFQTTLKWSRLRKTFLFGNPLFIQDLNEQIKISGAIFLRVDTKFTRNIWRLLRLLAPDIYKEFE